jgi:hypothetical protein
LQHLTPEETEATCHTVDAELRDAVVRRQEEASAARAFKISPTAFEQAREALWEQVEAGSGSLGAASSESAAGCGRLRACGC